MDSKRLDKPIVSVGILTYNHGEYIAECLGNVFSQQGNFVMNVFICDDASQDNTVAEVKRLISETDFSDMINVRLIENSVNLGVVQNFKKLTYMLDKGDYFTFCEGDDYWSDNGRIQTHIDFLDENPEFAFSFNANCALDQNTGDMFDNTNHEALPEGEIGKEDLIITNNIYNTIGNLGVGFYRASFLNDLNSELFDLPHCGDWMFNLAYSEFGKVGYIKKQMNVYRRHAGGIWSTMDQVSVIIQVLMLIDEYNRFSQYSYDAKFQEVKVLLYAQMANAQNLHTAEVSHLRDMNSYLSQHNSSLLQHNSNLLRSTS